MSQKRVILKTIWIPCLVAALFSLAANSIFTPIEPDSGNTRLALFVYGLFQLVTWGFFSLFLLALAIAALDLIIFRNGKFSRTKLLYETSVLVLGMLIIGIIADEVGTGIMLCLGILTGQIFRCHRIERKLNHR